MKLWHESGGSGDGPTLVLLHGLGANADVWGPFKQFLAEWPGRWLIPDLRGHGRSPHQAPYSFGTYAADVADLLAQDEEVVVLGHSMGGVVALALASGWFGVRVRQVIACGVKTRWTEEEVARAKAFAVSPARWFETRDEAVERYLRVSGLAGLVEPASAMAQSGVHEEDGRFRLAADQMVNQVAGQAIEGMLAAAQAPVRFGAGVNDAMVTLDDLQALDTKPFRLENAGHNLHVEQPAALWQVIRETLGS